MFDECVIRGRRFAPARFCAPLVGYTHSAFRRLVAELGGCGAVWTEMLAARQILSENFSKSPWLRRHPQERCLVYQLMVNSEDPVERVLGRLEEAGADALDLNLACNSKSVRSCLAGSALFEDLDSLRLVLRKIRRRWPHVLTAKIRLGHQRPEWQPRFVERLRLLEEAGVDAVILHTRFFEEKFKRRARHELFPWAASLTRLPLIANGDLTGPDMLHERVDHFQSVSAIMLGRMAVARPWIFATWDRPANVDLAAVWDRMYHHVIEDFPPALALRRLQMFTKYFAANFKFGHQFNVDLARASSLQEIRLRADAFFSRAPATVAQPTVAGL
ncbi:MAG TPA: tRNA-dihydrouridine synthase family protein [Candidatus Sulfotelmatobacter sp.]|nr:tRNA-dihydrouridine synthase family protein [Candidatus Sulfotelmatobacter sp.]